MSGKLLKQNELIEYLRISRSTLWRFRKNGTFPEPIKIGGVTIRWRESEIETWLDSCKDSNLESIR